MSLIEPRFLLRDERASGTARGLLFMREWLKTHIVSNHVDHANAAEVHQLVIFCIGEARVAAIPLKEIEDEYGETIEAIIVSALHRYGR
jgi:hypothetical protein